MTQRGVAVIAATGVVFLAGCGSSAAQLAVSRSPGVSSALPSSAVGTSTGHPQQVTYGTTEVKQFLDAWSRGGLYAAGRRYLVEADRVPRTGNSLVLLRGRVLSAGLYRWTAPDDFTLLVTM